MSINSHKSSLQGTNPNSNSTKKEITGTIKTNEDDENEIYFSEYRKLLQISLSLHQQKLGFLQLKSQLQQTIYEQQSKMDEIQTILSQSGQNQKDTTKPKRVRRTNNMIEKKYKCPIKKCQKIYGSEGSLQQHLKIKHQEYDSQSEEQEIIRNLFM